jgi:tRNA threonylcarbamoyl adenosine modification protein YjeE
MSPPWVIADADERDLCRLAEFIAVVLKPGDTVTLSGELGAGKTTFARAVIRAVLRDDAHDVPSPTFALVQSYNDGQLSLAHIDCYRMSGAEELQEIGLDDALVRGAALIEWPDRIADALPKTRLEILISDGSRDDTRKVSIEGLAAWSDRSARLRAMMEFCESSQWRDARPAFLKGDASTRAYARLVRDGASAILMDSPPRPDGPPVKDGKPYSQLVHLAEDVRPFVAVAAALRKAGLSVPEVFGHDLEQGFLITEDLGDRVYSAETGEAPTLEELYKAAVDVLAHLKDHPPGGALPLPDGTTHAVPPFDAGVFETEAELLMDWFYPAVNGGGVADDVRAEFLELLGKLFAAVDGKNEAWVLRDYHSPNLLWLPEREGIARVGVIDFQDALSGHAAYDLVSLLQDARRDIPAALEARLIDKYCEARACADSSFDAQAFATAYAVLGAQRNSKILGIFARLAKRDGKHGYLAHIPRVSAYLERNLAHPALGEFRAWFAAHLPADLRSGELKI